MINSFRGSYYFLSNFYTCPVTYDGITYENNEAAFQAQKCIDKAERYKFSNLNPTEAKHLGRKVNLRKDWEEVKFNIMKDLITAKFEQNADLREKLVSTGTEYLEEGNTWGDRVWGTVDGKGANLLGEILMEVREEINSPILKPVKKITR